MVRLYIQVASSTESDFDPRRTATEEEVMTAAKKILSPYKIEWERVEWFSVYPIGQGIAEKYTLDERVFLGGDAVHTHSVGYTRSYNFENSTNFVFSSPKQAKA
jgi:2-polyprenyl-6-methoxyphenol hydroxylase-like FAD-dependent oxidoreductase